MIKAIIVDDEPLARMVVKEYLQAFSDIVISAECNDGFEGVKAIMHHQPDLIFLDIQMPKINGFEMLELIENPPAVIFTTAFDEYALKAFETYAVDYLLKPFSKERFAKAVGKWMDQKTGTQQRVNVKALIESPSASPSQNERIVVKLSGKIKIIPLQDVLYLEAADDYVKINTKEGVFLKNRTMAYFEQILVGNQFVRCHRSYMVNVLEISRIDPHEKESFVAILRNGLKVPVSKTGHGLLRKVLGL